jgi:hypothetical protein
MKPSTSRMAKITRFTYIRTKRSLPANPMSLSKMAAKVVYIS